MKKTKQFLSLFLALIMLMSAVPMQALAASKPKAPSISVSTGDSAFTVSWKKISGASAYKIYYTTDSKFKKNVKTTTTTSTKKTVKSLKSYTKYYIRVKTCTGKKKKPASSYSVTKSIITNVRPTSIKSLSGGEASFTAMLSEAKNCKYQIQYSTNSDFSGAKTVNCNTSALVKKLGNSTGKPVTFYVRARSYRANASKKNIYTSWTGSKKVTTKQVTFPKAPRVDAVSTALSGSSASATFNFFNYDGKTTAYRVQIATNNTFRTVVKTTGSVSSVKVTVSGLSQDTVYYYRTQAVRNLNGVEYVSSWTAPDNNVFKTPASVASQAPQNVKLALSNENKQCDVSWDALGSYANVSYTVQYSTSAAFPDESYATTTKTLSSTNTSFSCSYNYQYFVRVRANITVGDKIYQTPWSGTQNVTAVNPYEITSAPKITGTSATKTSVTLTWNAISNATGYEIQYSANKQYANAQSLKTTKTTATAFDLSDGTTYYFRVRAYNGATSTTYYSAWATQSVATKAEAINEGVVFTEAANEKGEVLGYTVNKPCIYSEKDMSLAGDEYSNYVPLLKQKYAEIGILKDMTDIEKYVLICDWIQCNITYGKTNADGTSGVKGYRSPYDALTKGQAVCYGYAGLFNDFCYLAGIPCYFVVASGWNHAYNAIKLQGYWYLVDPQKGPGMPADPYSADLEESIDESGAWGNLAHIDGSSSFAKYLETDYKKMIEKQCKHYGTLEAHKSLDPMWLQAYRRAYTTDIVCRNTDQYEQLQADGYKVLRKSW